MLVSMDTDCIVCGVNWTITGSYDLLKVLSIIQPYQLAHRPDDFWGSSLRMALIPPLLSDTSNKMPA